MRSNNFGIVVAILLIALVVYGIVTQVRESHKQDDPMLQRLRSILEPMFHPSKEYTGVLSVINGRDVMQEITLYKGKKSFTVNKEKVYLCLTDNKGEYYQLNMLIFVTLHEIAHVLCDEVGHTTKFHRIFDALLKEAEKNGIYNSKIALLNEYCDYDMNP